MAVRIPANATKADIDKVFEEINNHKEKTNKYKRN